MFSVTTNSQEVKGVLVRQWLQWKQGKGIKCLQERFILLHHFTQSMTYNKSILQALRSYNPIFTPRFKIHNLVPFLCCIHEKKKLSNTDDIMFYFKVVCLHQRDIPRELLAKNSTEGEAAAARWWLSLVQSQVLAGFLTTVSPLIVVIYNKF